MQESHRVTIGLTFYYDRLSRNLPFDAGGTQVVVKESKQVVTLELDGNALSDLWSDAELYAEATRDGWDDLSMKKPAQSVLKALRKQLDADVIAALETPARLWSP